MEASLVAYLLAQTSLTDLSGQRITWARRDQGGALPCIVLHRIDGLRDYHHAGASGLITSRVQVDCWAATFGAAKGLARAQEAVVSGGRFTQGAIRFDAILIADERDDSDDLNGTPIFRTSLDLMIHHSAA